MPTFCSIVVAAVMTAAAAKPRAVELHGVAVDGGGVGVGDVTVFAIDARTGAITARVQSGADGRFSFSLPRRRHLLDAEGPGWTLLRLEKMQQGSVRLVMRRQPDVVPNGRRELVVTQTAATQPALAQETVSGRVVDDARSGLGGVRLSFVDQNGQTTAAVTSAADGGFKLLVRPGRYVLLVFAPGLHLQTLTTSAPNRWHVVLGVDTALETVHIREQAPDPDNPSARERARLAFQGKPVSSQPRVSPTLADLHASGGSVPTGGSHPVARQPAGAFCLATSHCSQSDGPAVCCASDGQLADEYVWAGGRAGTCKPAKDCIGARRFRRLVPEPPESRWRSEPPQP
jgi:hypothetical protein